MIDLRSEAKLADRVFLQALLDFAHAYQQVTDVGVSPAVKTKALKVQAEVQAFFDSDMFPWLYLSGYTAEQARTSFRALAADPVRLESLATIRGV